MKEITDLEKLSFNLQEEMFPYFTPTQLQNLLDMYGLIEASRQGCMMKAMDDSITLGKINIPSNEKYWNRRALSFRDSGVTSFSRVDEGGS